MRKEVLLWLTCDSSAFADIFSRKQQYDLRSCRSDHSGAGDARMKTIEVADAVAMIPDGASLMIGGFMAVGTPERVIDELVRQGKRNLTVIANDTAMPGRGIGKLVTAGLLKRVVASHIGLNAQTQQQI